MVHAIPHPLLCPPLLQPRCAFQLTVGLLVVEVDLWSIFELLWICDIDEVEVIDNEIRRRR